MATEKTNTFVPVTRPSMREMLGFISFSTTYRARPQPSFHTTTGLVQQAVQIVAPEKPRMVLKKAEPFFVKSQPSAKQFIITVAQNTILNSSFFDL